MSPYIAGMRENIAADLGVVTHAVSVKAKTAEKLGLWGAAKASRRKRWRIIADEDESNRSSGDRKRTLAGARFGTPVLRIVAG